MKTILTTCHVYSQEKNYVAFDELAPEDSQPIAFLKKVMPDYAWLFLFLFFCCCFTQLLEGYHLSLAIRIHNSLIWNVYSIDF